METPKHMYAVADFIRKISRTPDGRGAVNLPLRHGKSTACVRAAAHAIFSDQKDVALVTHCDTFAKDRSHKVRQLVTGFGADTTTVDEKTWKASGGGSLYSSGYQGTPCGSGFDVILANDWISGPKEALSYTIQDSMWDLWDSLWSLKIKPGGSIIVVGSRWSCLDIFGRLKRDEPWQWLIFPAIAMANDPLGRQEGEELWPEQMSLPVLYAFREKHPEWFGPCFQQQDGELGEMAQDLQAILDKKKRKAMPSTPEPAGLNEAVAKLRSLATEHPDLYAQLCRALADRHKLKTALDLNDAITSVPAWKDAPPEVLDKCVYRFACEGPKIEFANAMQVVTDAIYGAQTGGWECEKHRINKEGLRKYIAWLEEELVRPTATETYRHATSIRLESAREVLAKLETEDGTVVRKPLPLTVNLPFSKGMSRVCDGKMLEKMAPDDIQPVCTCKSLLGQRDKDCPVHREKP